MMQEFLDLQEKNEKLYKLFFKLSENAIDFAEHNGKKNEMTEIFIGIVEELKDKAFNL